MARVSLLKNHTILFLKFFLFNFFKFDSILIQIFKPCFNVVFSTPYQRLFNNGRSLTPDKPLTLLFSPFIDQVMFSRIDKDAVSQVNLHKCLMVLSHKQFLSHILSLILNLGKHKSFILISFWTPIKKLFLKFNKCSTLISCFYTNVVDHQINSCLLRNDTISCFQLDNLTR